MTEPGESLSWWEKIRFLAQLRYHLRMGFLRIRDVWWQILQTAVAASAAWILVLCDE